MITEHLFAIVLGLILGSFLLTVAMRLQNGTSLWKRSHCDHCSSKIGVVGLIPVLGYLILRGKCSRCAKPIAPIYPEIEVLNAAVVWLIAGKTGLFTPEFLYSLIIFETLLLTALIDFRSHLIYPHPILIGLVVQCFWLFSYGKSEMLNALFGLFLGAGIFHWVSYLYTVIRKKEGLGAGDATLLGLIGFIFGWQVLFSIIFWASVFGIIGGSILLLKNRQSLKGEIAFGPWLVLSAFLVWRFAEQLQHLPLRLSELDLFIR